MRRMYKNLSPEEMDLSIKLCKILMKTSVVCKILVNFSSISIYANDYAFLRSVVTKLNSSQIRELWSPITPIKKDTITFNAKAFAQGNEEVVEDLLKKIPGLTVEADGTIKIGDQEVEKVMIDGDDFFERGYKLLTKNMPAQPIDKIELLQNYSNNRLLKGIEQSERVALNLKLDENAKRIWFGNMTLGYDAFLMKIDISQKPI
jgi:hypothetical protein